jgi:hypothetical protein
MEARAHAHDHHELPTSVAMTYRRWAARTGVAGCGRCAIARGE